MKTSTPTALMSHLFTSLFLFFAISSFSQVPPNTLKRLAKVGSVYTLDFPEEIPSPEDTYKWVKDGESFCEGSSIPACTFAVDSTSNGLYCLVREGVSSDTLVYIQLDILCSLPEDSPTDPCHVCGELVVRVENEDEHTSVKNFLVDFTQTTSCMCDTFLVYRANDLSSIPDIEQIKEELESMVEVEADFNYELTTGPAPDSLTEGIENAQPILVADPGPTSECQKPVLVAIIDSGVQRDHTFFSGSNIIWENPEDFPGNGDEDGNCLVDDIVGYDFLNREGDDFQYSGGHGTHVAGIIADDLPSGGGGDILKIIDNKFYEPGHATLFDAVCAMHHAMNEGAHVLNLSWGFGGPNTDTSAILVEVLDRALEEEVLVAASAGNTRSNNDSIPHWPSNLTTEYSNMIAVAAATLPQGNTSPDYIFASEYSNYGVETVDVAAPGTFIESTYPEHIFEQLTGTSMATAYVSRLMAHARACRPDLTAEVIVDCILANAMTGIDPSLDTAVMTMGVIDYMTTMGCVMTSTSEQLHSESLKVFPQPFSDRLLFDLRDYAFQQGQGQIFNIMGQCIWKGSLTGGTLEEIQFNPSGNNYAPGTYFYLIWLEEGVFSGKLVKQ